MTVIRGGLCVEVKGTVHWPGCVVDDRGRLIYEWAYGDFLGKRLVAKVHLGLVQCNNEDLWTTDTSDI
jgi:hypothetical protein